MIPLTQQLLALASAYCEATDVKIGTLSFRIFNDSKIFARISNGNDITTGRFEKAIRWFSENWPENAVWPETVARPTHAKSDEAAA